MSKEFNVTGKCLPNKHYMADVSHKMAETLQLIDKGQYFIINRPRQYGKTTTLYSISDALRKKGDYIVFNISFEGLDKSVFDDDKAFAQGFMRLLAQYARYGAPTLRNWLVAACPAVHHFQDLSNHITDLMDLTTHKIVVLIDEVDQSSNNDVFIKFLALLRNKFLTRDEIPTFHSVVLAGVHDIKSLKLKIRPDSDQKYNSPWNIAADFKVDMNLHPSEIKPMLADYAHERGVAMDVETMSYGLFYYTSGYPFLVSRLCKIMDEELLSIKKERSWTMDDLEWAVKRLVKEHNTNFEAQVKNLETYPDLYNLIYRVAIDGEFRSFNIHNPVTNLAVMYGLLTEKEGRLAIHNRIYNELIVNYMTNKIELSPIQNLIDVGGDYRNENRTLNFEAVLLGFQSFMKQEYSRKDRDFLERHARLVFLSFLKPIINGAGYDFKEPQISEEKRLDVVITYYEHKYIAELKLWRGEKLHEKGLIQLANYLETQQVAEGYLLIFDHAKVKNWASEWTTVQNKQIFMVWV
jgi:AAA-like domain/PD-(D/E)XK nuclease superfamily